MSHYGPAAAQPGPGRGRGGRNFGRGRGPPPPPQRGPDAVMRGPPPPPPPRPGRGFHGPNHAGRQPAMQMPRHGEFGASRCGVHLTCAESSSPHLRSPRHSQLHADAKLGSTAAAAASQSQKLRPCAACHEPTKSEPRASAAPSCEPVHQCPSSAALYLPEQPVEAY